MRALKLWRGTKRAPFRVMMSKGSHCFRFEAQSLVSEATKVTRASALLICNACCMMKVIQHSCEVTCDIVKDPAPQPRGPYKSGCAAATCGNLWLLALAETRACSFPVALVNMHASEGRLY